LTVAYTSDLIPFLPAFLKFLNIITVILFKLYYYYVCYQEFEKCENIPVYSEPDYTIPPGYKPAQARVKG